MKPLLKNKKGFIQLLSIPALITVAIFLVIVVAGLFIFTALNKYVIIGGGMIALVLIFGFRGEFNKTKATFMVIIIVAGLVFIFASSFLQNITGLSNYEDNQGNFHWVVNGIATGVDEGYTFRSLPSEKTNSKGDKVQPKEEASLFISKDQSYCEYQLKKVDKSRLFGLIKLTYYELNAPERVVLISVKDDSGQEEIIDGTITRSVKFYDNGGTLTFTSYGIQGGKKDCQSGSNVAIRIVNRQNVIVNKDELNNWFNSINVASGFSSIIGSLNLPEVRINNAFLGNFETWKVEGTDKFIGDVEIGDVEFSIDADQKYYNSVIVTPPKEADPIISNIDFQKDAQSGSTRGIVLTIVNNGVKGNIVIDATTTKGSISPTSKNAILNTKLDSYFTLKSPEDNGNGEICFDVCSVQGNNCDNKCKSFSYSKQSKQVQEPNRDITQQQETPSSLNCALYETEGVTVKKDYGFLYWRAWTFQQPKETPINVCVLADWVKWLGLIFVILALGGATIYIYRPKRRKR